MSRLGPREPGASLRSPRLGEVNTSRLSSSVMGDGDAAREFHRLTTHDPAWRAPPDPRLVQGFRPIQPQRRPPQFKTYPGIQITPLPRDVTLGESRDAAALGSLLFLGAGVTRVKETAGGSVYFPSNSSPSHGQPLKPNRRTRRARRVT
jgi:hypothetical protein